MFRVFCPHCGSDRRGCLGIFFPASFYDNCTPATCTKCKGLYHIDMRSEKTMDSCRTCKRSAGDCLASLEARIVEFRGYRRGKT